MHDIMVKPLPAGCRLTAIFDASSTLTYHLNLTTELFLTSAVILDPHWVSSLSSGHIGTVSCCVHEDLPYIVRDF